MKYLVTGGTGMIGRQVVRLLCDAGHEVESVSMDYIEPDTRVKYYILDLTDMENCMFITSGKFDGVFHLAGIKAGAATSTEKIASHFVPTLMFNTNVLEACRQNRIPRVVYTSSIGAYPSAPYFTEGQLGKFDGEPMDFAGWAKLMGEFQIYAYQKQYGLDWAILRPSNVFGPGDNFNPETAMVVPSLLARVAAGEYPLMIHGDGTQVRDIVYSEDVARGIITAMERGTQGRYVNLGSGREYTIRQLAEAIKHVIGTQYIFDGQSGGYPRRVMDIGLAKKMLGYNPQTTLVDGIYKTWHWLLANPTEHTRRKDYLKNEPH